MHGRVNQANGDRQAVHCSEKAVEVAALVGQQNSQGRVALSFALGQDHALDHGQALGLEEHMLGAGQADALGAKPPGAFSVARVIGVGPNTQGADLVGPAEQLDQVEILDVRLLGRDLAGKNFAGRAVKRSPVAFFIHDAVDRRLALFDVHFHGGHADHSGDAKLARHQGGMAGAATAAGENALGCQHAVHVVGRRLRAHHNHGLFRFLGPALSGVGVEDNLTNGRARRHVQADGNQLAATGRSLFGRRIELRVQIEVHVLRHDALDCLGLGDQALVNHIHRDADGRLGGALGITSL